MSSDVAVLCKFKSADENLKMFFPGWESSTDCLIRDSSGTWDLGLILQLATVIAAFAAVWISFRAARGTLNRDLKSRAINAHEHWIDKFFLLDLGTDLEFQVREDLVQDLKTRMGAYAIHLNLHDESLPIPLRNLASDIRKVFEVETRVRAGETKKYLSRSEVNSAKEFLKTEGLRRVYRSYVSSCAAHVAAVLADQSTSKECLGKLRDDRDRLHKDFKILLDLYKKFLEK